MRDFRLISLLALLILLGAFALYEFEPFEEFWNNLLSNLLMIFAAGSSAFFAFLTFRKFDSSDQPRMIWALLALGLWLWTLAEALWALYNLRYGEVGLSVADFFWVAAYVFFGVAVYLQYQLLYRPVPRVNFAAFSLWILATLLLTALIARLLELYAGEERGLALWVASFYPAADFSIGLAAAHIVYRFRGGALGYPWLGLFLFAAADIMYAVLEAGGFYSWSVNEGNRWSMAADLVYLSAYLAVGLGCAAQWLLLKYGPIFGKRKRKADSR